MTRTYETPAGRFHAVRGVDLSVARGEFVALRGKSGSGKSTLLNLIGGIDRPTTGQVSVADTRIGGLTEDGLARFRGRHIGFVFQFFQLLPTLSALENVMLPMDFAGTPAPLERRSRARDLLARVGVADQAEKLPATLSGGQQQRVAIARALANAPAVLLADEPTGNLDSATADEVLTLFRALSREGVTVVLASHEREITRFVDRAVEVVDGSVRA